MQRFFATAGLTIVGAAVSMSLLRGTGIRALRSAAYKAANEPPGNLYERGLRNYREIQEVLDEYQGLQRIKRPVQLEGGRVLDDPTMDTTVLRKSFIFTDGEKERMRVLGMQTPAEWTLRDEMQQRMVKLARRLPYELPAVYVTQRFFSDRLLGVGPDEPIVQSWVTAPVDIIGDFAQQSLQNLAFAFIPFEGGVGAAKHGWRRALTSTADSNYVGVQKAARDVVVDVNNSLQLIGQHFSDITANAIKFSRRSTGAMSTAITDTAAKKRSLVDHLHQGRHGTGGVRGWLDRIASGEEVFGPVSQMRNIGRVFKREWDRFDTAAPFRSGSASRFEDSVASVHALSGGAAPGNVEAFFGGAFYRQMASTEYRRILARHLDVDDEIAGRFTDLIDVTLPLREGQRTHVAHRLRFGQRQIFEGADDSWQTVLGERLEPIFQGHGRVLARNLERGIQRADREFLRGKPFIDERILSSWNHAYRNLITREVGASLGRRKMPFADFGPGMGDDAAEFLLRRTAERVGIHTHTASGVRRHTSEVKHDLRNYGFDPANRQELRSLLIEAGDISKPWNPLGYNFLGLRAMSVQDVLDRGLAGDQSLLDPMRRFGRAIQQQDWDPLILSRMRAGGLYQTRHGDIVDVGGMQRSFRGAMDTLAREYHIPLIHVKPFEMAGYGMRRDPDFGGAIQFVAGGRQPFLPQDQLGDGYFWFKGRRGKGRVGRLFTRDDGTFASEMLPGQYRPMSTDPVSMAGRSLRYAIGESGRVPAAERQGWRKVLNVDEHQPMSLFAAGGRFARRKDDITNPAVFARKLLHGDLPDDPAAIAEGVDIMLRMWRNSSFSQNLVRHTRQGDPLYNVFNMRIGDDVVRIPSANVASLRRAARREMEAPLPQDEVQASILQRARNRYLKDLAEVTDLQSMNQPLSYRMARVGLHREVDRQRLNLMRYQALKDHLPGTSQEFDVFTSQLIRNVENLFGRGMIGSREAAQARAAIGSFYADFHRLRTFDPGLTPQQNLQNIAERLTRSVPGIRPEDDIRRVLQDTIEYRMSGEIGRRLQGDLRLGVADYRYGGFEYNPFGVNTAFVPTFRTAFERDPVAATRSVLGSRTWDDPQAFSGAGIVPTHLFDRMNRFISVLNLGVDAHAYTGPLQMFFKGVIGQRLLPLYVAGTTFMAIDRTVGGYVHGEKDARGERVYRPLVTGAIGEVAAAGQIAVSGVTPWGMTAQERADQLRHGDVPIRRGRFWPFGSTPVRGGQVEYFRPSWYRRLRGAYQYTDQLYGSPMERLLYGHDFSPLRPLDPYRFEEKHYDERPYPVTGEYFTGPWGPATAALNLTIGRVLKPPRPMHEESLQHELSRFRQVGARGMAPPATHQPVPGEPTIWGALAGGYGQDPTVSMYTQAAAEGPPTLTGTRAARSETLALNNRYILAATGPYVNAPVEYPFVPADGGSVARPRQPLHTMLAAEPISAGSLRYQAMDLAYLMQEYSGIYGFTFGALRDTFGFGELKYGMERPVLESARQAYGFERQFWDLGLGGLGDIPTPFEGRHSSLELSELVRRFVPRPRYMRAEQDMLNPIPNLMGLEHPWLPGEGALIDFHRGDPFTRLPEGEMRLPGAGYERFRQLHPDETGRYGRLDRLMILADVAPYSSEFRQVQQDLLRHGMSLHERELYERTMERHEIMTRRNEFSPYEYKYSSPSELGIGRVRFGINRATEAFAHQDSWLHSKLIAQRTAVEDWERTNVYGTDFARWHYPVEDFVKPALWRAADRNPLQAGAMLGLVGGMFGVTPQARATGALVGGVLGSTLSTLANARELVTGERFVPARRRREMALEEYTDILEYTRALRGFTIAQEVGDPGAATQFQSQMQRTMYGMDLFAATPEEMAQAVPKRKREHFMEMLHAPEQERGRILSTAPRLERRMFQAAWGMRVERRPSLEEYFEQHELPPAESEIWDPRINMDHVQIKMINREGLHASQMGFFPQQERQAHLVNPPYPQFGRGTANTRAELERLMRARGMTGSVREIRTPFPGVRVQVQSGV